MLYRRCVAFHHASSIRIMHSGDWLLRRHTVHKSSAARSQTCGPPIYQCSRADRAEQGRDGERTRADALRDRLDALQAELATAHTGTEAEKEARRRAEEALQAAARWEANENGPALPWPPARLRAAWRGA
jgi:hypothetical protein